MVAGGEFVVVWQSYGSLGSDNSGASIQGQRFAADGIPLSGEFQVNSYTTAQQSYPSIAVSSSGDFVVAWQGPRFPGYPPTEEIQARRFTADGSPIGQDLQVNSYTTNGQWFPCVAAAANSFVVVWQSYGSSGGDSSELSTQAQRFATDGTPLAGEFQVNSYTTSYQGSPGVAMDRSGNFVVAWHSFGSFGSDYQFFSVQGQRFGADGSAVGGEFQVNDYITESQRFPDVVMGADAGFVVVWHSDGSSGSDSGYGYSVQARRFGCQRRPQRRGFTGQHLHQRQPEPRVRFWERRRAICRDLDQLWLLWLGQRRLQRSGPAF